MTPVIDRPAIDNLDVALCLLFPLWPPLSSLGAGLALTLRHCRPLWAVTASLIELVGDPGVMDPESDLAALFPAGASVLTADRQQRPRPRLAPPQVRALPSAPAGLDDDPELDPMPTPELPVRRAVPPHRVPVPTTIATTRPDPTALSGEALLRAVEAAPHAAIIGPTGAGKSTLLAHVVTRALRRGERVTILDPHGTPGKWPDGADVVGAGRSYTIIGGELAAVQDLMIARYEELARGEVREGEHPLVVIVADEWRAIAKNSKGAGDILGALITEARKVRIKVVLGGQSHYLSGLGLDDSAVRESLAICRLSERRGQRVAALDGREFIAPAPLAAEVPLLPNGSAPTSRKYLEVPLTEMEVPLAASKGASGKWVLPPALMARVPAVRAALAERKSQNQIVTEVWQIKASGNAYYKALDELREILAWFACQVPE
jgi:hypothetical protein